MPDVLFPVLVLSATAAGAWLVVAGVRGTVDTWAAAASGAGAYQLRRRFFPSPGLHARIGDFELQLELGKDLKKGETATWIHLQSYELVPIRVDLRPERVRFPLEPQFMQGDVPTGDATFDAAVEVTGHPVLVSAILDEEPRRMVLRLISERGKVESGRISKPIVGRARNNAALSEEIAALADLARALESPSQPWLRLARNARQEALRGVRARNLELLTRHFAQRAEARAAAREARHDPWEDIRVIAAVALKDEEPELLRELALSPASSDRAAATAVRAFGTKLGVDRALDLLTASLRGRRRSLALAVIAVLGELGGAPAVERLRTIVDVGDDELATAAVARTPDIRGILMQHPQRQSDIKPISSLDSTAICDSTAEQFWRMMLHPLRAHLEVGDPLP